MAQITNEDYEINPGSKFKKEYVEMAARLKACGFSNEDIAWAFGVSKSAINTWQNKYSQFRKALEGGREVAKGHLVAKAFMAAAGYDYVESNEKYDKDGNLKERSVFHKHQAPNPKLVMWLLCNLAPEEWRSEHKITVERDDTTRVVLDGKIASKQIDALVGKLMKPKTKKVFEVNSGNDS